MARRSRLRSETDQSPRTHTEDRLCRENYLAFSARAKFATLLVALATTILWMTIDSSFAVESGEAESPAAMDSGGAVSRDSLTSFAAAANSSSNPFTANTTNDVSPSLITDRETLLTVLILAFGVVVLVIQYRLLLRVVYSPDEILRVFVITLILIGALATVAAGYSSETVNIVIGLFGTIIGYLLGKSNPGRPEQPRRGTPDELVSE